MCRFNTPPCVRLGRLRVYRQRARMYSTCGPVAGTHGDVVTVHTEVSSLSPFLFVLPALSLSPHFRSFLFSSLLFSFLSYPFLSFFFLSLLFLSLFLFLSCSCSCSSFFSSFSLFSCFLFLSRHQTLWKALIKKTWRPSWRRLNVIWHTTGARLQHLSLLLPSLLPSTPFHPEKRGELFITSIFSAMNLIFEVLNKFSKVAAGENYSHYGYMLIRKQKGRNCIYFGRMVCLGDAP